MLQKKKNKRLKSETKRTKKKIINIEKKRKTRAIRIPRFDQSVSKPIGLTRLPDR